MKIDWDNNERNNNNSDFFPKHHQAMMEFRLAHHAAVTLDKTPWLLLPLLPKVTTIKYNAN